MSKCPSINVPLLLDNFECDEYVTGTKAVEVGIDTENKMIWVNGQGYGPYEIVTREGRKYIHVEEYGLTILIDQEISKILT